MNESNKHNKKKKLLVCPNCGVLLAFLMSNSETLYCNKCKKYYVCNNNSVGKEIPSPPAK